MEPLFWGDLFPVFSAELSLLTPIWDGVEQTKEENGGRVPSNEKALRHREGLKARDTSGALWPKWDEVPLVFFLNFFFLLLECKLRAQPYAYLEERRKTLSAFSLGHYIMEVKAFWRLTCGLVQLHWNKRQRLSFVLELVIMYIHMGWRIFWGYILWMAAAVITSRFRLQSHNPRDLSLDETWIIECPKG